jgi:hypothetical protein
VNAISHFLSFISLETILIEVKLVQQRKKGKRGNAFINSMHKVKKRLFENKRGLGMEKGYLQKKIHCDLMNSPMFFSFVYGFVCKCS